MKSLIALAVMSCLSMPVFACGDIGFGPDYTDAPCPVGDQPPFERIPLAGHDRPIWLGARADETSRGYANVTGHVVGDFAVLIAHLPNGTQVAGISNQCISSACPYLGEFARQDLNIKIDFLSRAWFQRGE